MAKREKKGEFDGRVWPTILEFNVNIDSQLTGKANFVFGATTLVTLFLLNKILSADFSLFDTPIRWAAYVLVIGSSFAALISLMIVLPRVRIFSKKVRKKEDIFYYKNIKQFYSREGYYAFLKDLPKDNERISKAYANQVYSLATSVLPHKFNMLKVSGWAFIISLFAAILVFVLSRLFF